MITKTTYKFQLLTALLVIAFSVSASPLYGETAQAKGNSTDPQTPIWETMTPRGDSSSPESPPAADTPAEKLNAKIIAETLAVKKGETISFSLESNQNDVRYFWNSNGQKSTRPSLIINTATLEPGKHRVLATVTNANREQAHSSIFFTVLDESGAEIAVKTEPSDTTSATAVTAPNAQPTPYPVTPVETDSNITADGKIIELPVPDKVDTSDAEQQTLKVLSVIPATASIAYGDKATFSANVKQSSGFDLQWKFADQRGEDDSFEISTDSLEPGNYLLNLAAIDKNNQEYKAEANVVIREKSPELLLMPDLTATDIDALRNQLELQGLYLGKISQRIDDTAVGKVVGQQPEAGKSIARGSLVDVVVGITSEVPVPSLLGQSYADARKALAQSDLKVETVNYRIDDNAVDTVIGQNPSAETPIKRGQGIELTIGKAMPALPEVRIQPALAIVEKGKAIEFEGFIVNPDVDKDIRFKWDFNGQTHEGRSFIVNTGTLETGQQKVYLQVTDAGGQIVNAEATIDVTARLQAIPDLSGKSLEEARALIADSGLTVGVIERIESEVTEEIITAQKPLAGEQVAPGSRVALTMEIPRPQEEISIVLSADSDSVKEGEALTFTIELTPKQNGEDIHYVYTINAEKKANVRPQLEWIPEEEGIYTVTVAAFSDKGMLAKSSPLTIDVSPAWEKPVAKIIPQMQVINQGARVEFTSTSTYDLNTSLEYDWESGTQHSGAKKHFSFDTTDIEPGSYAVTLTVTDSQQNTSTAKAMLVVQAGISGDKDLAQSEGQGNVAVLKADPAIKPEITLAVSNKFVSTGTEVSITANSSVPLSSAYYYFEVSDGAKTQWRGSNELAHTFEDFGTYVVRAAVKHGDKVYYSNSISVWVWSPLLLFVTLGIVGLFYAAIWWRTKRASRSSGRKRRSRKSQTRPTPNIVTERISEQADTGAEAKIAVNETQVPLNDQAYSSASSGKAQNEIFTEAREPERKTVSSVLLRAALQFVLGIVLSIVILYVIVKAMNLA